MSAIQTSGGATRPRLLPVWVAALAAAYFLFGKLGLALAYFHPSATPVWPPTGISLAALLILGYRLWPGVWLGAFLVNLTTAGTIWTSIGIATGNTLEALLGAWLLNRFANGLHAFDRAPDIFRFVFFVAGLSTAVSATFGVTTLELGGFARTSDFVAVWVTWWLGDMMSALLITPLLVIWSPAPRPHWPGWRTSEALLMLALVVVTSLIVFGELIAPPFDQYVRPFMCLPPLLWAAFRFEQRGAATSCFVLTCVVTWATLRGHGALILRDTNESLLLSQIFLGVLSVTNLVLAAVVSEQRRAAATLRKSEEQARARAAQLQAVMQSVPAVVWVAHDADCRVITGNPASYELLRVPASLNVSRSAPAGERPTNFAVLKDGRELSPEELPVQRAARGEEVRNLEEEVRFADGTSHHLLGNAVPLRDSEGKLCGSVAAFVDITERKAAERRLAASLAVTRILAESPALADATPRILQTICETLGWEVGAMWTVDAEANVLRCLKVWHGPAARFERFVPATCGRTFAPGIGLPGRVWSGLTPAWIPDVTRDDNFPRAPFAAADGLHGAFGFPIVSGGRCLGLMEFFSHQIREPDEAVLAMLAGIGGQIGQFMDRKRAEEAIRAAETQLELIADASPVLLTRCSRDLRYLFVNRACAELLGSAPERIIGRPILEVIGAEAFETIRPYVSRVLEGQVVEYEAELAYPGAGPRFVRASYVPDRDERGQVRGWVASILDISERKRAETALRESEVRFRTLAETASDAIITVNERGTVVFANSAAERMFGYAPAELCGAKLTTLMPEGKRAPHSAGFARYLRTGKKRIPWQSFEVPGRHKDGRIIPLEIAFAEFAQEDRGRFFTGIARDITARKQAEAELDAWRRELERRVDERTAELTAARRRLEEEIETRQRLEAEVARAAERERLRLGRELHEGLGQQLAGIGLLMASVRSKVTALPAPIGSDLQALQRMLQASVGQARTLAKGFYPVELEQHGLLSALRELADSTGRETGVPIELEADEESPAAELKGPIAIQLFRIAQEAVHNAARHARARSVSIHLSGTNGGVMLAVCDDGVGLPANLDPARGMGMQIMRYRAQTIGGKLDVRSKPGGGVTVACTAPLAGRVS